MVFLPSLELNYHEPDSIYSQLEYLFTALPLMAGPDNDNGWPIYSEVFQRSGTQRFFWKIGSETNWDFLLLCSSLSLPKQLSSRVGSWSALDSSPECHPCFYPLLCSPRHLLLILIIMVTELWSGRMT